MRTRLGIAVFAGFVALAGAALLWRDVPNEPPRRLSRPAASASPAPLEITPPRSAEPSPDIRVNLTPTPVESVTIEVSGPYQLRPVDGSRVLGRGDRGGAMDATVTDRGIRLGPREFRVSGLEIIPEDSPSIWVNDHQYRGTVRLVRRPGGTLIAVNVLPLDEYLASVIDSELPATFPPAAREAQAIVARTYALYQMQQAPPALSFDLYATTRSQKYLGFQYRSSDGRRLAGESDDSRRIARETAGMVCVDRGELFCTYYSAVCGGRTTPGRAVFADAAPPLQSVPCEWCSAAERYRWTAAVPTATLASRIERHFASRGRPFGPLQFLRQQSSSSPGAATVFEADDGRRRYELSGSDLRGLLPGGTLPSPRFEIRPRGDQYVFEGRGHGHGVGFCQWGARGLALADRSATEIIEYYYPGCRVVVFPPAENR